MAYNAEGVRESFNEIHDEFAKQGIDLTYQDTALLVIADLLQSIVFDTEDISTSLSKIREHGLSGEMG